MSIKDLKQEWIIIIGVILAFAFIIINVDQQIGSIYTAIFSVAMAMAFYFVITGKTPYYSVRLLSQGYDWVTTALFSLGAFGLFSIVSQFLISNLALLSQSVLDLLQATSPVLSNVPEIQFFTFSILIPTMETFVFFVLAVDVILSIMGKTTIEITDSRSWVMSAILGIIFTVFHFNAKLVRGSPELLQPALMVTFIFAVISVGLVLLRKQWAEALFLHIGINGWTMYNSLYATG